MGEFSDIGAHQYFVKADCFMPEKNYGQVSLYLPRSTEANNPEEIFPIVLLINFP